MPHAPRPKKGAKAQWLRPAEDRAFSGARRGFREGSAEKKKTNAEAPATESGEFWPPEEEMRLRSQVEVLLQWRSQKKPCEVGEVSKALAHLHSRKPAPQAQSRLDWMNGVSAQGRGGRASWRMPLAHRAAKRSDPDALASLVKFGADPGRKPHPQGSPLLHCIVNFLRAKHPKIVEVLAEIEGEENNALDCARILLKAGADPNEPAAVEYGKRRTVPLLFVSARGECDKMTQMLLDAGARADAPSCRDFPLLAELAMRVPLSADMVRRFVAAGADVNQRGPRGFTPFLAAIQRHNKGAAEALAQLGADSRAKDPTGMGWRDILESRGFAGFSLNFLRKRDEIFAWAQSQELAADAGLPSLFARPRESEDEAKAGWSEKGGEGVGQMARAGSLFEKKAASRQARRV